MKIIYPNSDGGICLVMPSGVLPVEEVARKDVPAGVPYLLVSDELIPEDHVFFNAWEADFSVPHGHGIGSEAWFAEQTTKEQV